MPRPRHLAAVWSVSVAAALAAGGCGSDTPSDTPADRGNPGALSAEARSAATGDIPDNQVFLVFRNGPADYSITYPEGWTQAGSGNDVTFKDRNNLVRVAVGPAGKLTTQQASASLAQLRRSSPSLVVTSAAREIKIGGRPMIKSGYSTRSPRNPVTGKRVTLLVDRYQLAHGGRTATVDLGTPRGVDNVDAYRLMIESFKWR